MKKRKNILRKKYKYFKKSNLGLINKTIRILSWLLPGLVIKRWMITSAIGFLTALLGFAIWTSLRPFYWLIEVFFWLMTGLTSIFPVSVLGPIVFFFGISMTAALQLTMLLHLLLRTPEFKHSTTSLIS